MSKQLVKLLKSDVDQTIEKLSGKKFKLDPLAGKKYSKVVSVLSSSYKRHGFILERAILEQLKTNPDFVVWEDRTFHVDQTADHIVDTIINDPINGLKAEIGYSGKGHRTLQVDVIVFNKKTKQICAYEIKRGNGLHDSGKRRSILRDLLCVQVLLKSYAQCKGYKAKSARSYIVFYYGARSIPAPFSFVREELNDHFGFEVVKPVEAVNRYFQKQLFKMLES